MVSNPGCNPPKPWLRSLPDHLPVSKLEHFPRPLLLGERSDTHPSCRQLPGSECAVLLDAARISAEKAGRVA